MQKGPQENFQEMDSRNQILTDIWHNFYDDFVRFLDETGMEIEDLGFMKKLMANFIVKKAEGLRDEELLTAFGDSEKVLDEYIAFLKVKLEVLGEKVH